VEVSNPVCGDVLRLAVKIADGHIREARFLCRGCTTAIACASWTTERILGAEPSGVRKISAEEVSAGLGGLPAATFHAAQMAVDALKALAAEILNK
jgi:nitrogen fixation NifU-like protein